MLGCPSAIGQPFFVLVSTDSTFNASSLPSVRLGNFVRQPSHKGQEIRLVNRERLSGFTLDNDGKRAVVKF